MSSSCDSGPGWPAAATGMHLSDPAMVTGWHSTSSSFRRRDVATSSPNIPPSHTTCRTSTVSSDGNCQRRPLPGQKLSYPLTAMPLCDVRVGGGSRSGRRATDGSFAASITWPSASSTNMVDSPLLMSMDSKVVGACSPAAVAAAPLRPSLWPSTNAVTILCLKLGRVS